MLDLRRYVFILVLVVSSFSISEELEEPTNFYDYRKAGYPLIRNTYKLTSPLLNEYEVKNEKYIDEYPSIAFLYYFRGIIKLSKIGVNGRSMMFRGMTRREAHATDEIRLQVHEMEEAFRQAIQVHLQAKEEHQKLSKWEFYELITKANSNEVKEQAIRLIMDDMSPAKLRPDCGDDEGASDCVPIADSWPEYLYDQYFAILSLYRVVADIENLNRVWDEFEQRLAEDEWINKPRLTQISNQLLAQWKRDQKKYFNGLEKNIAEGKIVPVEDIPEDYKSIQNYWHNYIVVKGTQDFYQWDIRDDVDSPDGYEAKMREKALMEKQEAEQKAQEEKEEQERIEAERKAEEARLAEENRLAEEARIKSEKEAEEQRIQAQDERIKLTVIIVLIVAILGVLGLLIRRRRFNG